MTKFTVFKKIELEESGKDFGEALNDLLLKIGLSYTGLAKEMGVFPQSLSRQKANPPAKLSTYKKIADAISKADYENFRITYFKEVRMLLDVYKVAPSFFKGEEAKVAKELFDK